MKRCLSVIFSLFLCLFLHAQTHDTDVWTVFGDAEIVNGNKEWNVNVAANTMTEKGGIWTLTVKNARLYKTSSGSCHPYPYYFAISLNHSKTNTFPEEIYDPDEKEFIIDYASPLEVPDNGYYDITYSYNDGLYWWDAEHYELEYIKPLEPEYTITVESSDPTKGTVTGGGKYVCGDKVTIQATPLPGSRFIDWSDGNLSATRTVTVTKDATYTAHFAEGGYVVIGDGEMLNNNADWTIDAANRMVLQADGSYSLTVRKMLINTDYCHAVYRCAVVLSSDPTKTYPDVMSGGVYKRSKGTARKVSVTGIYDITYTFKEGDTKPTVKLKLIEEKPDPVYTLSAQVSPAGCGTVSGAGEYECGDEAVLVAESNAGYCFVEWDDGETNPTRTVTMTEDQSFTAIFDNSQYTINVQSNNPAAGSVSGGGVYTCGQTVTISAANNEGFCFSNWSDGSTSKTRTFTATEDKTLTAIFKSCGFYLELSEEILGGGSGGTGYGFSQTGDGTWVITLPNVTLYKTGDCVDPVYFSIYKDEDKTFAAGTYITPVYDSGIYTITITWKEGQKKPTFKLELVEYLDEVTFLVTAEPQDPETGVVTGGGEYEFCSDVTLKATPNPGYQFVGWDNGITKATQKINNLNEDTTVIAIFKPLAYTIVGEKDVINGTSEWDGTAEDNLMTVDDKKVWTLTVKNKYLEETGDYCRAVYQYAVVKDNGTKLLPSGKSSLSVPETGYYDILYTYNQTSGTLTYKLSLIEAVEQTYEVKAMPDDPAKGSVTNITRRYSCGETVKIKATPRPGFRFLKWSTGSTKTTITYHVEKTDTTFIAYFEPVAWTLIGDEEVVNGEKWDPTNTSNDMHLVEGVWTITIADKQLEKTGTGCHEAYRFGVANDHSLDVTYPTGIKSGSTYKRTKGAVLNVGHSGRYNIIFTYIDGETQPTYRLDTIQLLPNPTYKVTVQSANESMGSAIGSGDYECGSSVTIRAIPTDGKSVFTSWSDGNKNATRTLTNLSKDITLTAYFSSHVYTVVGDYGAVYGEAEWDLYQSENDMEEVWDREEWTTVYRLAVREVPLVTCHNKGKYEYRVVFNHAYKDANGDNTAWPEDGREMFQIYKNGLYDIIYTLNLDYDMVYADVYLVESYGDKFTITATASHENRGTVSGGGTYKCGKSVTLTATANPGYLFKQWSDGNTEPTRTFEAVQDMALIAQFDCEGGCAEVEELYLGYEVTTLTYEQKTMQPTWLAYPDAVTDQLAPMPCAEGEEDETEGALKGVFSVSQNEKVRFSKGNLQYDPVQDSYSFASAQYEFNNSQYLYGGDDAFWKKGITGGNWRILTDYEWEYLFNVRKNHNQLIANASIEGVYGCILFPDNYVNSGDIVLAMGSTYCYENIISTSQWKRLEEKGAVFLPYDDGMDDTGNYWTSTKAYEDMDDGWYSEFYYYINIQNGYNYIYTEEAHFSESQLVRLVTDVK